MSLTMILSYTGKNGAAQKYAEEMKSSGLSIGFVNNRGIYGTNTFNP